MSNPILLPLELMQGKIKPNLLVKVANVNNGKKNACRNLTRLIRRIPGAMLRIPIDACKVSIQLKKPLRRQEVYWPLIRMDDWCKYLLKAKPRLLLGGHIPSENWKATFRQFWADYRLVDPNHPVYTQNWDLGGCLPYFFHGDEGRGQLKRPFMVISFQLAIGHLGVEVVNDTSNLVCLN